MKTKVGNAIYETCDSCGGFSFLFKYNGKNTIRVCGTCGDEVKA